MLPRTDQWAYRIPFGLQWMWPLPLFIGVLLAPESPWWLVRKGRLEEAKHALLRLTSLDRETDFDADETIDMMRHTTELEREITSGSSYLDCFRGSDLRRTEIVCMVWAMQNLAGNSFSGYATYFLQKAGVRNDIAFDFTIGIYAINCAGVFGAWGLMSMGVGRRTLYLYGLCGLCAALFIMGFLGLVPEAHRQQAAMATGAMMIIWAAFYQCTVGTIAYSELNCIHGTCNSADSLQVLSLRSPPDACRSRPLSSAATCTMSSALSALCSRRTCSTRTLGTGATTPVSSGADRASCVSSTPTSESPSRPVAPSRKSTYFLSTVSLLASLRRQTWTCSQRTPCRTWRRLTRRSRSLESYSVLEDRPSCYC